VSSSSSSSAVGVGVSVTVAVTVAVAVGVVVSVAVGVVVALTLPLGVAVGEPLALDCLAKEYVSLQALVPIKEVESVNNSIKYNKLWNFELIYLIGY
jgi:hypothetical protein